MSKAGAAQLILDKELSSEELFHTIERLAGEPGLLEKMGQRAKQFANGRANSSERFVVSIVAAEGGGDKFCRRDG